MATIDGYYVLVESEEPSYEVEVTEQPVEKGISLTDHVQRLARTLPLSGSVAGKDASKIHAYLVKSSDEGKIVKFLGRTVFSGVITGLTTSRSYKEADGFNFSLTLREIRVARATPTAKLPAPVRSQAAPIISAGVKKTKSASAGKKEKDEVQVVKFKSGSKWAT